ncbi:P-loop containing nucleoside triphosphate hydrolase protein, partial [Macrophomina phaseolina]
GRIEFRNLTAAYVARGPAALCSFSLVVTAGGKLAICGLSGSGKTSVMLALLQMLIAEEGDIVVDGQSIAARGTWTVSSSLAVISQEFGVLPGFNLRQHVDPCACATDEQVTDALRRVKLWDEQLEEIGLEGEIKGGMLSAGQMLLIAVAVAMIRRRTCKIVLVDEATSNVDGDTAKLVQTLLRRDF